MGNTKAVTDATFISEVLQSDTPVLVDFWAEWCGPCLRVAPVLEEIATEMGDKVKVVKLDIDANPNTARDYQVLSVPTLTLFKGGSKNYKALVTDVSLKGSLSGWEAARQIREKDPAFPVVYMTGAAADEWASQGVPNSILLQKPFAPAQLVTAVSQLLNTGSSMT